MFIIPVGTKSALALKPKVTISLIVICIVVHMLTSMTGGDIQSDLFKVERKIYHVQVHLFLLENDEFYLENGYIDNLQEMAMDGIAGSSDYADLESNIFTAMGNSFSCFKDLESFGNTLYKRDASFYEGEPFRQELLAKWKDIQKKEESVLNRIPSFSLGLVPRNMNRFWTFVTHLFLHGDIWHLLGNMLFLWVVGCLLEDTWGRGPFLAFYLCGGIFAGLAHCLQDTSSGMPLIGASGAIAAAMGAFTVRHFMTKIRFFYFFLLLFRPFWGTFHLPAFVFLPFWFIQQVALKSLSDSVGGSNVAYLAHIMGYLAGIVTALIFRTTGLEEKVIDPLVKKKRIKEGVLKDPRFDEACDSLRQGGVERAKILFSQLVRENPENFDLAGDIAMIYREAGIENDYLSINELTMKNLLLKGRMDEASGLALDMIHVQADTAINPQLLHKVGKHLQNAGRHGEAHDIYRSIIKANISPTMSAKASIALAKLLSSELNNVYDAIETLDYALTLEIEPALKSTILEIKSTMESLAGSPCKT
ncbi:MAG: rhomboid family intramembrane serine protease [Candidatus Krumholzibacteria bacterium]|nr:rhomboid family intramembrane serine protease [Candidatus Krumholzibacteria bacterium]